MPILIAHKFFPLSIWNTEAKQIFTMCKSALIEFRKRNLEKGVLFKLAFFVVWFMRNGIMWGIDWEYTK